MLSWRTRKHKFCIWCDFLSIQIQIITNGNLSLSLSLYLSLTFQTEGIRAAGWVAVLKRRERGREGGREGKKEKGREKGEGKGKMGKGREGKE